MDELSPSAAWRSATWQIGEWIADPTDDSLSRQGASVKIEPRLMQLLICLASSAPQVVSIEKMLSEVWGGVVVGPASVYQSISQLRKTLGDNDSPPRYIETVARKGYRLVAPVKRLTQDPALVQPVGLRSDLPAGAAPLLERRPKRWLTGALAAVLLAIGAIVYRFGAPPTQPEHDSIVVLPFVDLSAARDETPFCDGLTEELSSWLAQLPQLNVVARTSAFAFRDKVEDVREIGRRLGTTHVLEGSVRRNGDALRVTVKLVATKSGYEIWTNSYDASRDDVLGVQEQIARAVATNLEVRLTQNTLHRFDARRSENGQAYRLYLIARHHLLQRTLADNTKAIELFSKVIELDERFALAYVGLATAYLNQRYFIDRPITAIAADVEPLLAKAQHLQPDLAELYATRGALETEKLRPVAALRDLKRAVQLDPNSRDAVAELGFLYLTSGEPRDALASYTRAGVLDPLSGNLQAQRCMALHDLAQFDEAELVCERARALEPKSMWTYAASSWLGEARGRLDDALKWNQAALERSPDVIEVRAQRGLWWVMLGLPQRAAQAHQRALRMLPADGGFNLQLLDLGFMLALETGGVPALRAQLRATPIDSTASPEALLRIAQAELMADEPEKARELVDRALADPSLDPATLANAWHARTGDSYLLIAALAKQKTNDPSGAEKHLVELSVLLDRLTAAGMQRHGIEKLRAQIAALRGDGDQAMRSLQAAANLGWYCAWCAEREPYFESLRNRPDYRDLTAQLTQANARMRARLPQSTSD
jgi:TolB-like protein/DNA-binding winged helix-turn-helix (wHTH) protein